jgi:hypothetical protein
VATATDGHARWGIRERLGFRVQVLRFIIFPEP